MFRTIENSNVQTSSRTWLNHLTEIAVKTRDELLANASTEYEAFKALSLSINDILLCMYQDMTNAEEWRTLQEWEQHGYKLKNNAKPFYVWGKRLSLFEEENNENDEATKNLTVMTVYNSTQVIKSEYAGERFEIVDNLKQKQRRKKFDYLASLLSVDTGSKVETLLRVKNAAKCGTIREIKRNELFIVGCDGFNLLVLKNKESEKWQVLDLDSGEESRVFDSNHLFQAVDDIAEQNGVIAS